MFNVSENFISYSVWQYQHDIEVFVFSLWYYSENNAIIYFIDNKFQIVNKYMHCGFLIVFFFILVNNVSLKDDF